MEQAPGPQTPGARSRGYSFRSDKSGGSRPKEDLTESPREKQRRDSIWKSTSKANPNAALNEAQPGAVSMSPADVLANPPSVNAILEESTISSLRGLQHKDVHGNPITDPDLSNPTRPRMERPLDTIRSFEAAIDHGYKRRSNYQRAESLEPSGGYGGSRRNSGYGHDGGAPPNRHANGHSGGYYGGRPDVYGGGQGKPRYGASRMQSEPMIPRPHQQHVHQHSHDTMNTGVTNGSDSTGPWANSTDPSSENSSIDKNYPQNGHAPNGYDPGSSGPIPEDGAYPMRHGGAPPVQPPNAQRRPIPLGNSGDSPMAPPAGSLPQQKRPEPEKHKSWLKRRFSKKE